VTQPARATSTEEVVPTCSAALLALIDAVRARVWLQRIAHAVSQAGALVLTLFGLGLVHAKLRANDPASQSGLYSLVLVLPALLVCRAAAQRTSRLVAAQLIDRRQQLPDLVSSAWAFSQLSARSTFMNAALGQAAETARHIDAAAVLRIGWPRTLAAWPLLGLGVLCAWQLPNPPLATPPRKAPATVHEILLSDEDVATTLSELERSRAAAPQASSLRALTDEFERLLELVTERRIDRLALLRSLADIETRALQTSQHSTEQDAALRELGRLLASHHVTEELGAALASGDLHSGRTVLQQLAKRVANTSDRNELERLRAALRSASSRQVAERARRMAEARRSLETLRRERAPADAAQTSAQRAAKQQALDASLRQERAAREHARELDRLERELGQPVDKGADQPDQLARDLQAAAETLDRMQAALDHDRALSRLNQRIDELRQRLAESAAEPPPTAAQPDRQPGPAGEQALTLQRFQRRAQGDQAAKGEQPPAQPPRAALQSSATPDSKPGTSPKRLLAEGSPGTLEHAPSARGRPERGPATPSGSADVDLAIAGIMGKGPSRSAVIYDAAARGFGTQAYQKVHADYAAHAEHELEREPLPAGYRFYVRRYFQLIQPREAAQDSHE